MFASLIAVVKDVPLKCKKIGHKKTTPQKIVYKKIKDLRLNQS